MSGAPKITRHMHFERVFHLVIEIHSKMCVCQHWRKKKNRIFFFFYKSQPECKRWAICVFYCWKHMLCGYYTREWWVFPNKCFSIFPPVELKFHKTSDWLPFQSWMESKQVSARFKGYYFVSFVHTFLFSHKVRGKMVGCF